VVDDVRLPCRVVSRATEAGWFSLILTVQHEAGRDGRLEATGRLTRDRWLDFPESAADEASVVL